MKRLSYFLGVVFSLLTSNAQTNLVTSELVMSSQQHKNLSQSSSIDLRTMENRNFPIEGLPGWMNNGGPINTTLKIKLVTDQHTFVQEIDGNSTISATANYLGYQGSASFSEQFENDYHSDERTISIVMQLEANYGLYGYQDPRLKPTYSDMLEAGNGEAFINNCGTHFVQQSERIVRATAVIKIKNVDESTKRLLSKKYSASVSGTFASGSANVEGNAHLQRLVNTSKNMTDIEVDFNAIGAGGTPALKSLVATINKTDVNEILSALGDFIQTGTRENSAPSQYYLASYKRYGIEFDDFYNYNETYLAELYTNLFQIVDAVDRLKKMELNRPEYVVYYQENLAELTQLKLVYEALLDQCIHASNCSAELPKIPAIYWPENWVENPVMIVTPHYKPLNQVVNNNRAQILDNITVRLSGYLLFPEYFNQFEFGYFDAKSRPVIIQNFVAGDRTIFEDQESFGAVQCKPFLSQVDSETTRLSTTGSFALNNQENHTKSIKLLETIGNREYFIKSYDREGRSYTTYLGKINTSEISSHIR